jgi:hypothetical protein
MGMIGGYRLASAAVDMQTDELARQSRRISDELRVRRRFWGRKKRRRVDTRTDEVPPAMRLACGFRSMSPTILE